ncbi:hypothetical protein N7474_010824 [Penicillium riverlandense]|uniref:uncharacterized protein n=1 Tax=Penicillium riverlandense TaxID=1903569 RepID=UPI0025484E47|nr:uncharacterized protein N7474_010824 [Penicillium riverlandense]KAJ5804937.1 hypothetical protein N7474_010824 [Penicillium riverlandense]
MEKPVNCSSIGNPASGWYNYYPWQPSSVPELLKGGRFAAVPSDNDVAQFSDSAVAALQSGALSWLWIQEQVFIVRVSEEIYGTNPCTMNVSGSQDLFARECDGSTAFFFIKNTGTNTEWDAYDPVPGYNQLQNFSLNALDVATAAYNSQVECNCWEPIRTITQTLQFLQSSWKPASNYQVNLPVCDLDYLKSSGAWPAAPGPNPYTTYDELPGPLVSHYIR